MIRGLFIRVMVVVWLISSNGFADITTGLIAYYPFDGNAKDASGGNHDGIYSKYMSGKFGMAAYFDGVSDYIAIHSLVGVLPDGNESRTISMWLKSPLYDSRSIVSWGTYIGFNQNFLIKNFGDHIGVNPCQGTGVDFVGNTDITPSTWEHFVIVYDGNDSIAFYKNGVYQETVARAPLETNGSYELIIGSSCNGCSDVGNFYEGAIDELRIYNCALTASDIVELYNYKSPQILAHGGVLQLNTNGWVDGGELVMSDHTIEAWINTKDSDKRIAGYYASDWTQMYVDSVGKLHLATSADITGAQSTTIINDGRWHHIAYSCDTSNSTCKGYVDGIEEINIPIALNSFGQYPRALQIGGQSGTESAKMFIDEVRIWSKVRTGEEISNTMNVQLNGDEPDLFDNNYTAKLYINGDIIETIAGSASVNMPSGNLYLGWGYIGSNKYKGTISEFSLWNMVLSIDEIRALIFMSTSLSLIRVSLKSQQY